jgi:hypothetical protein
MKNNIKNLLNKIIFEQTLKTQKYISIESCLMSNLFSFKSFKITYYSLLSLPIFKEKKSLHSNLKVSIYKNFSSLKNFIQNISKDKYFSFATIKFNNLFFLGFSIKLLQSNIFNIFIQYIYFMTLKIIFLNKKNYFK